MMRETQWLRDRNKEKNQKERCTETIVIDTIGERNLGKSQKR